MTKPTPKRPDGPPLEAAREMLRYQAQAQVCSLSPKNCDDLLYLLDWIEALQLDAERDLEKRQAIERGRHMVELGAHR